MYLAYKYKLFTLQNVAIGQECPEGSVTYDDTDVMLYALGGKTCSCISGYK